MEELDRGVLGDQKMDSLGKLSGPGKQKNIRLKIEENLAGALLEIFSNAFLLRIGKCPDHS